MNTSVTEAGPYEKLVTLQIPDGDLEEAKTRAARRLSRDLKIKGFRPGKAPRRIVEATVGSDRLKTEAIEDLLPGLVGEVLEESDLRPAVSPRVESMKDLDDGLEIEVRVTTWPKLDEVPDYEDLEIEVTPPEVSAEEIEAQLDRLREQFADLDTVQRPATDGDFVLINLSASDAGAPIEDASASDLLYEVGSGGFVEGIDGQVVGKAAGEIVSFDGPLPEGFGDRAGRSVSFRVLVKEVKAKRLPDLTDEWASETTEFDTIEELRAELAGRIEEVKRASAGNQLRAGVLEALLAEIDLDIPEAIIEAEMESVLHRFSHQLEGQGISLSDYLQVSGQDQQVFIDDLRNQADRNVRTDLLLEAVAEREELQVDDDDLAEVVEELAKMADQSVEAFRSEFDGSTREKIARGDILKRKALDALINAAVPVDETGGRVDLGAGPEEEKAEE